MHLYYVSITWVHFSTLVVSKYKENLYKEAWVYLAHMQRLSIDRYVYTFCEYACILNMCINNYLIPVSYKWGMCASESASIPNIYHYICHLHPFSASLSLSFSLVLGDHCHSQRTPWLRIFQVYHSGLLETTQFGLAPGKHSMTPQEEILWVETLRQPNGSLRT